MASTQVEIMERHTEEIEEEGEVGQEEEEAQVTTDVEVAAAYGSDVDGRGLDVDVGGGGLSEAETEAVAMDEAPHTMIGLDAADVDYGSVECAVSVLGGTNAADTSREDGGERRDGAPRYRRIPRFAVLTNGASRSRVSLGSASYSSVLYCGRALGTEAIPRSDGRCGPFDGPQCGDCRALTYRGRGRLEVLRRTVPALDGLVSYLLGGCYAQDEGDEDDDDDDDDQENEAGETRQRRQRQDEEKEQEEERAETTQILVLALRASGGIVPHAASYLCERLPGLRAVSPPEIALPPLPSAIGPSAHSSPRSGSDDTREVTEEEQSDHVAEEAVRALRESLGIDSELAEEALRRNGNDAERAASYVLDEPDAAAAAVAERAQEREMLKTEERERRLRHERALEEACLGTSIEDSSFRLSEHEEDLGGDDGESDERRRRRRHRRRHRVLKKRVVDMVQAAISFQRVSDEAEEATRDEDNDEEKCSDGQSRQTESEPSALPSRRVLRVIRPMDGEKKEKEDDGNEWATYETFAVSGHLMDRVRPSFPKTDTGATSETMEMEMTTTHCLLCSGAVPSPECGDYVCQRCNICEGCIQSLNEVGKDGADGAASTDPDGTTPELRGPAFCCPALGNGTHLHAHPLTYNLERRRTCHCDIGESGCKDILWSCVRCDFDACAACMARPAPVGYDRLSGMTTRGGDNGDVRNDDDDDDDDDDDEGDDGDVLYTGGREGTIEPGLIGAWTFDHVAAERRNAARWEGEAVSDPLPGEAVVGTGEAAHGDSFVVMRSYRPGRRRDARKKARMKLRSTEPTVLTETKLTDDAEKALDLFRSGEWRRDDTGTGGGKTRDARPPKSAARGRDALPQTSVVPAADLAHAEELLHRARVLRGDASVYRDFCRAVASGRIDLAGSLLLSGAFAPVGEDAHTDSVTAEAPAGGGNGGSLNLAGRTGPGGFVRDGDGAKKDPEEECWCGFRLDSRSSPDGSVGCLGGHAMHPSCASDLLLSGGSCPTCRMQLYYPHVPEAEAMIAKELVKLEMSRSMEWTCTADDKGGTDSSRIVAVGDFVLIDPDPKKCHDEQMREPRSGGWFDDMGSSCGMVGRITELIAEGGAGGDGGDEEEDEEGGRRIVAARVRTKAKEHRLERIRRGQSYHCDNCSMYGPSQETGPLKCSLCHLCGRCCLGSREDRLCPKASYEWTWAPSLLRKTIPDLTDFALLDREEAPARIAEGHVMSLRAELKAIAAAREALRAKSLKIVLPIQSGAPKELMHHLRLHKDAINALCHLWGKVSFADWTWARHLLDLAQRWYDDHENHGTRHDTFVELCIAVREGDLDSAARTIRRRNASLVAERLRWEDAVRVTAEYTVSPTAKVELRAFPANVAPRTGFYLHPGAVFRSAREIHDADGNLWLRVDPQSFVSCDNEDGGKVVANMSNHLTSKALVGARVRRGPDWKWNDQDGGEGNTGVIIQVVRSGKVSVRWDAGPIPRQQREYRAGNGCHDLVFAGAAPQAPQGWLRVRPAGRESPAVVWRSRSALRCFCCGDGLVPPRSGRGRYTSARGATIKEGDKLLVAATLETVVVKAVSGGRVRCDFASEDDPVPNYAADVGQNECHDIWYRLEDLVLPKESDQVWGDDEVVRIKDQLRTRHEVVLMSGGDDNAARQMWDEAKKWSMLGKDRVEENDQGFASCIRGHFLHARCLQGALLDGRRCPAIGCKEPLCVPQVKRLRSDDTSCGAGNSDATNDEAKEEVDLLRTAENLVQSSRASGNSSSAVGDDGRINEAGLADLKMCPACCSGPLINENCSDMNTHHGQCSRAAIRGSAGGEAPCTSDGIFRVPAAEIAELIKYMLSSQVVTDVLPKCPTHQVPVLFSGCLSCGHLFTDIDWHNLPKWDPKAKSVLELDSKKRRAAELLSRQVRAEVALYQFEQDQFNSFEAMCGECSENGLVDDMARLPPIPPPASKYIIRGCGPLCNLHHSRDGECLMCGRAWGAHSGHTCPGEEIRGCWEVR